MQWVVLATWIGIVLVVLPLGSGVLLAPPLGIAVAAGLAGLALAILFPVFDTIAFAWGCVGAALAGALAMTVATAMLTSDTRDFGRNETVAELNSGLSGVALPLFLVAIGVSALMAIHIGNVHT